MLYLIFAALVVCADQAMKLWVSVNVAPGDVMQVIPGVIHLTYVENTGAAFSILAGKQWLLITITVICVALLIYLLMKGGFSTSCRVCIGAVLGGALGNLLDRIIFGYVVDMFEFEFVRFAVFNIADIFITVGIPIFVILLLVGEIRGSRKTPTEKKAYAEPEPEELDFTEGQILQEYELERLLNEDERENDNSES